MMGAHFQVFETRNYTITPDTLLSYDSQTYLRSTLHLIEGYMLRPRTGTLRLERASSGPSLAAKY